MDEKGFTEIMSKFSETITWLSPNDPTNVKELLDYGQILNLAKEHTLRTMKCSIEKFHDVVELMIFEKEDRSILECYYSFLDNVRISHQ